MRAPLTLARFSNIVAVSGTARIIVTIPTKSETPSFVLNRAPDDPISRVRAKRTRVEIESRYDSIRGENRENCAAYILINTRNLRFRLPSAFEGNTPSSA